MPRTPALNRKKDLYLRNVGAKGRGLFCRSHIKKGEILESTPALVLNEQATLDADKTLLVNYTFIIGDISAAQKKKAGIKKTGHGSALAMGILAFCNHGEKPNAEIIWEEAAGTLYYMLRATANIKRDTEICTSYGDTWFDERN